MLIIWPTMLYCVALYLFAPSHFSSQPHSLFHIFQLTYSAYVAYIDSCRPLDLLYTAISKSLLSSSLSSIHITDTNPSYLAISRRQFFLDKSSATRLSIDFYKFQSHFCTLFVLIKLNKIMSTINKLATLIAMLYRHCFVGFWFNRSSRLTKRRLIFFPFGNRRRNLSDCKMAGSCAKDRRRSNNRNAAHCCFIESRLDRLLVDQSSWSSRKSRTGASAKYKSDDRTLDRTVFFFFPLENFKALLKFFLIYFFPLFFDIIYIGGRI